MLAAALWGEADVWTANTFMRSPEFAPRSHQVHSPLPLKQWKEHQCGSIRQCYWSGPPPDKLAPSQQAISWLQPGKDLKAVRAWLSTDGVVAHTHYDTYANTLVQLAGNKTVELLPPSAYLNLSLYPALHPGYRQSQLLAGIPNELDSLTVELRPGDALYIPPMWFHRTSASGSHVLSVNIWAISPTHDAAEGIFTAPVPLEEEWPAPLKATMLARYVVDHVLPKVLGLHRSVEIVLFITRWLKTRYSSIVTSAGDLQPHPLLPQRLPPAFVTFGHLCHEAPAAELLPKTRRNFDRAASKLAQILAPLEPSTRDVFLEDWLEEVAAYVCGEAWIVPYAVDCWLPEDARPPWTLRR